MGKKIVVYKLNDISTGVKVKLDYKFVIWKPSLFKFYPPNKNIKYIIYWIFHYLNIFSNKNYSAYLVFDNGKIISSLLVVPAHFKWPFMGDNDVQFTYVMTHPDYRGQGLASNMINDMILNLSERVDEFWYVTDTDNISSMRVAEKIGFDMYSEAEKSNILGILREKR